MNLKLCKIGIHNWTYSPKNWKDGIFGSDVFRTCKHCSKKQKLVEDFAVSGFAADRYWITID